MAKYEIQCKCKEWIDHESLEEDFNCPKSYCDGHLNSKELKKAFELEDAMENMVE